MSPIIYGTAWKKEQTKDLVLLALKQGFRAIDTACQPKHYHEPGVGEALEAAFSAGLLTRQDLFLQTKFTSVNGQDPASIPYNPKAPIKEQVEASITCSLHNLRTTYLDSWVLHGPLRRFELTMEAWHAMESHFQKGGTVKQIGLSNVYDPDYLEELIRQAKVKPAVLQNRFYRETGYDHKIREICQEHRISYQSFWTLTANPEILKSREVQSLCQELGRTPAQIFFAYVRHKGITPLTGTKNPQHMREDLDAMKDVLSTAQIAALDPRIGV